MVDDNKNAEKMTDSRQADHKTVETTSGTKSQALEISLNPTDILCPDLTTTDSNSVSLIEEQKVSLEPINQKLVNEKLVNLN